MEKLAQERCVPCTGDVPRLSDAEIQGTAHERADVGGGGRR